MLTKSKQFLVLFLLLTGFSAACEGSSPPISLSPEMLPSELIVGGQPATIQAYPWVAFVLTHSVGAPSDSLSICGGTVIAPQAVLTAAHCVDGDIDQIQVATGQTSVARPVVVQAQADPVIHPDYDPESRRNDLALIRLNQPLSVPTLALAATPPSAGVIATALGWGETDTNPNVQNLSLEQLRSVDLPIISDAAAAGLPQFSGSTMIAAGSSSIAKSTCQGDSGGPLIVRGSDNQWKQVGITSFGSINCNTVSVYTEIPAFYSWIRSQLTPSPTPSLVFGQKTSGTLTSSDRINPTRNVNGGRYYSDDYLLVGAPTGQLIQVTMTSQNFDTFLQIIDTRNGSVLVQNNNFNESNNNSQVKFKPISGVSYIIRATSKNPLKTGSYSLLAKKPT